MKSLTSMKKIREDCTPCEYKNPALFEDLILSQSNSSYPLGLVKLTATQIHQIVDYNHTLSVSSIFCLS
jgi:hypothetical protein